MNPVIDPVSPTGGAMPVTSYANGRPAAAPVSVDPPPGGWSYDAFVELREEIGRPIELVDGRVEVLEMPAYLHQLISYYFQTQLTNHVSQRGLGLVASAPFPIPLSTREIRDPDIHFAAWRRFVDHRSPPTGVDLAMEVVSPDWSSRNRDHVVKRASYAAAGIREYWIIDPETRVVTVLVLDGDAYREHGRFVAGQQATSVLLPGFALDVAETWAAGWLSPPSATAGAESES